MGCHSSKQARRDLLRSPSILPRSKSLPDNDHAVSLTSSTLGSLNLRPTTEEEEEQEKQSKDDDDNKKRDISVELAKARAWSLMIDRKIPRTPTETPPNEPEPINVSELMAGLHGDYSPFDRRSFSFYPISRFDRLPDASSSNGDAAEATESERWSIANDMSGAKKRDTVVFYFTSLRGIRRTYDDCCSVKAILREYSIRIDERDVSMHSGFKEELKEMSSGGMCKLPRVFIEGKDLGGAEEMKRMHETGELAKVFEKYRCNVLREKGEAGEEECEACGDVRFVMCGHCAGSCRVYIDEEETGDVGGWWRCSDCNENGIVRCPVCC